MNFFNWKLQILRPVDPATWINEIGRLIFPPICFACENSIVKQRRQICQSCMTSLELESFTEAYSTDAKELFWGRIEVQFAITLMQTQPDSAAKKIIHQLKYHNNTTIGYSFGRLLGNQLNCNFSLNFRNKKIPDAIIPVPLHYKKLKLRGHNQSTIIGSGLSETTGIPLREDLIIRKHFTISQTGLGRFDRSLNVENKFTVSNPKLIKNKHFLLVDDVVTTGSTLIECANTLLKYGAANISIATLAIA